MQSLQSIVTNDAPKAIGPYSQGVMAGDFLFVSGQIPINPKTGTLLKGDIQAQTQQVLENIRAILNKAGLTMQHVVRTDVFLLDLKDFDAMNHVYETYFLAEPKPARQTVQVAGLPGGSRIEISCIAYCGVNTMERSGK